MQKAVTTMPSPLRAVKRRAGDLDLAVLQAAQAAERAVRAGCGPTREELEEDQRLLGECIAHFERRRRVWSARLAGPRDLPCLACAVARRDGRPWGCTEHVAEDVLP